MKGAVGGVEGEGDEPGEFGAAEGGDPVAGLIDDIAGSVSGGGGGGIAEMPFAEEAAAIAGEEIGKGGDGGWVERGSGGARTADAVDAGLGAGVDGGAGGGADGVGPILGEIDSVAEDVTDAGEFAHEADVAVVTGDLETAVGSVATDADHIVAEVVGDDQYGRKNGSRRDLF